jgi:hypothetical protein
MKRTIIRLGLPLMLMLAAVMPAAFAEDGNAANAATGTVAGAVGGKLGGGGHDGPCQQMSLNLWGLSYHPDRSKGYNEQNWGAGFSCYTHPDIPWLLGKGQDNRLVIQGDALLNSWRGLMVPLSIGANWRIKTFSDGCKLYFVTAMTVAYYNHPDTGVSEVDWGPIPGVSIGCGRIRTNMMLVPSASRVPLAVAIASMSFVF